MELLSKPVSHIKIAKETTEDCLRVGQRLNSRITGDNANIRLIEANRPYMDDESHARADQTIAAIRAGQIRYVGIEFKSVQTVTA